MTASSIERTIFRATLIQDSALSISGIDAPGPTDRPFAKVNGRPVISASGLKGAAVAMARRCFKPLPRSISDDTSEQALVRSAWRFEHAHLVSTPEELPLRAGIGILQATAARAEGVLFDQEVLPADTRWYLELHVDWRLPRLIGESPEDVEGILGYVLAEQWASGRCWLGGGIARGLGWCHLEGLRAHRLTKQQYEEWPACENQTELSESALPICAPTKPWSFRTLELTIPFGEYRPKDSSAAWGVDMLAIGTHSQDRKVMHCDERHQVASRQLRPAAPGEIETERAIAMERGRPLLPGSGLRGPLRHAYSRQLRATGAAINDPHLSTNQPAFNGAADPVGALFGTLQQSARLLIRDGRAEDDWLVARLQQHAEDEFTAGSFESAKRNAVRLLRGSFRIQLVVEGACAQVVQQQTDAIDRVIALGELGHLPIGGHKTRGAGWSPWQRTAAAWCNFDVQPAGETPAIVRAQTEQHTNVEREEGSLLEEGRDVANEKRLLGTVIASQAALIEVGALTLGQATRLARQAMQGPMTCWWCEPRIDLNRQPPPTFGLTWPEEGADLLLDEVIFFGERESWRAARTRAGWRTFLLRVQDDAAGSATGRDIPASLHLDSQARFSAALHASTAITLCEWSEGTSVLGFTAKGPRS